MAGGAVPVTGISVNIVQALFCSGPTSPRSVGTPIRRRMRRLTANRSRAQRPNLQTFTNASIHDRIVMRRTQLFKHIIVILHLVACEMVENAPVRVATWPMCCRRQVLSPRCLERAQAIGCKRNTGH
jgi:hypothetical protein